jgi:hypothetical protein
VHNGNTQRGGSWRCVGGGLLHTPGVTWREINPHFKYYCSPLLIWQYSGAFHGANKCRRAPYKTRSRTLRHHAQGTLLTRLFSHTAMLRTTNWRRRFKPPFTGLPGLGTRFAQSAYSGTRRACPPVRRCGARSRPPSRRLSSSCCLLLLRQPFPRGYRRRSPGGRCTGEREAY